ncbi:MAG: hypothetical protein WAO67_11665 [Yoonia sp.]
MPTPIQQITPPLPSGQTPVPTIPQFPQPTTTVTPPQTIIVHPNPQITITGYGPVPTGTNPVLVPVLVPKPRPGKGPTNVPPLRPTVPVIVPFGNPNVTTGTGQTTGPVPLPNNIPHPVTVTVPKVPPQTVTQKPTVPMQTPQTIPVAIPLPQKPTDTGSKTRPSVPSTTLVSVSRPKPRPNLVPTLTTTQGATITHKPEVQAPAIGHQVVTRQIGRQPQHNAPRFQTTNNEVIRCVASGHGRRRSVVDGEVESTGSLRHVGAVDVLGNDLPALHPRHAKCLITVKRRKD